MKTSQISKDMQELYIQRSILAPPTKYSKKRVFHRRPCNEWTKKAYAAKKIGSHYYYELTEFCGKIISIEYSFWAATIKFKHQTDGLMTLICGSLELTKKLEKTKGSLIDIVVRIKQNVKDNSIAAIYVEDLYGVRSNKSFSEIVKSIRGKIYFNEN